MSDATLLARNIANVLANFEVTEETTNSLHFEQQSLELYFQYLDTVGLSMMDKNPYPWMHNTLTMDTFRHLA